MRDAKKVFRISISIFRFMCTELLKQIRRVSIERQLAKGPVYHNSPKRFVNRLTDCMYRTEQNGRCDQPFVQSC